MLRQCYDSLDGSKAVGIDGITKEEYGKQLATNLEQLLKRIRQRSYHPKASRIVEIQKTSGGMRPLAISCLEDKIVQEAVKRVLERIFEPLFVESSYGFRPGLNCHMALSELGAQLGKWECGAVLEIDLQSYFNTIPHGPLIRMLEAKIVDKGFLRLIIKLLKAPILNSSGISERNQIGSPQGSILSPLISNIYLHYVLDTWFVGMSTSRFGGSAHMVRYADDVVFTFRTIHCARSFKGHLVRRLAEFGIQLHEGKTAILASGRREAERHERQGLKMPVFTFLGFLHVWGTSINRNTGKQFWRVKRHTCPLRYRNKLAVIKAYIRKHRHEKDLILRVKRIIQGYLNYFAVKDNSKRISQFVTEVRKFLFKYLNRRSQRCSFDWDQFQQILKRVEFPEARILKDPFFSSRQPSVCR